MRKIVLFVAVLLFMAVPAMAVSNVTITCTHGTGGDANLVTVSYASDHNLIRAFGLDIDVNNANDDANNDANITQVWWDVDGPYRIFPGQISIVNGDVNEYKTPYALSDINDTNVTIEMGSLYTTDANYDPAHGGDPNMGYNMIPGLSGTLLKFRIRCGYAAGHGTDCNYVVTENVLRGGIVMEDPYEYPNVTLCDGNVVEEELSVLDFGDAPQSYSTKLIDIPIGPSHVIITGRPILGTLIDAEADGNPTANCNGDDATNLDDEDGVVFNQLIVNESNTVNVTVSQAAGYLNAWIDWGRDGSFATAGDQVVTNLWLGVGPHIVPITIPAGAVKNTPLVSRWRITSYDTPTVNYYGAAIDGEVEDYNDVNSAIKCHVPNCVGDPNATAQNKLIANGFTIGTITTQCNNTIPAGNVIITDPPFCTTGQCDVPVNLVVSKGNNVPNVVHMTQANACAAIVAAGYVCNPVDGNGAPEPIGQVANQKPIAGSVLACGSTVDVNVASYCLDPIITPTTEYDAWVAWGRPSCWCYKRQCRGDINGNKTVTWVALNDLNLFRSAYTKTDTQLKGVTSGICSDLNHTKTVTRVALNDLNIFRSYYTKAETAVPCCDADKNCILTTADKYNFWTKEP